MLTIKSLDTNYINIDTGGSINIDGGIYVKQIAPFDGTNIINIEGNIITEKYISCGSVNTNVISSSNVDGLKIEGAGITCDNVNTSTITPSGSNITVAGGIITGSDIECQNITINGSSSFNDIQGTNMVFSNINDKNVVIKSLIKDNEFVAVAYTPDINGTNHNVHSFIRLNSDGIVFWGSSIQLYADNLVSYPHSNYINIEKIHNY